MDWNPQIAEDESQPGFGIEIAARWHQTWKWLEKPRFHWFDDLNFHGIKCGKSMNMDIVMTQNDCWMDRKLRERSSFCGSPLYV